MRSKALTLSGWGRRPTAEMQALRPERRSELLRAVGPETGGKILARGGGRSYGDQAILSGGTAILTERLDRILAFDAETGAITVEPGVRFCDLLTAFAPRGWMVPVTPGTGFATIGGAVANDVHGKNHDRDGSFGDHVTALEILTAAGETRRLTPEETPELFAATLGGMGLTGILTAVSFSLRKVPGGGVDLRERRIRDIDHFLERLFLARDNAAYSVGWIDALAQGKDLGRGILETAEPSADPIALTPRKARSVPVDFPSLALNPLSVRLFNQLYAARVPKTGRNRQVPWDEFLYPLDAIGGWNRIYGKRGFRQFQCVVPDSEASRAMPKLLETIADAGAASFLAVLKTLGGPGRGLLSFPMRGVTLALDFPERKKSPELMARLERLTLDHGGRIYLAKDCSLSAEGFKAMYPRWEDFQAARRELDPDGRFSSDMARRLGLED